MAHFVALNLSTSSRPPSSPSGMHSKRTMTQRIPCRLRQTTSRVTSGQVAGPKSSSHLMPSCTPLENLAPTSGASAVSGPTAMSSRVMEPQQSATTRQPLHRRVLPKPLPFPRRRLLTKTFNARICISPLSKSLATHIGYGSPRRRISCKSSFNTSFDDVQDVPS